MSIAIQIRQNVSLLLEGWTLILAVFVFACAIAFIAVVIKGQRKSVAAAALVLLFSLSVLVPNSLLVNESTWQVMYAAYVAAPRESSAEYARDVRQYWSSTARGILMRDWYFMARRWGICHELWHQSNCAMAPAEREGMGIARELLGGVARVHSDPLDRAGATQARQVPNR